MSTTLETLFEQNITKYRQETIALLQPPVLPELNPEDGAGLKQAVQMDTAMLESSAFLKPEPFTYDFTSFIEEQVAPKRAEYEALISSANEMYNMAAAQEQTRYTTAVAEAEAKSEDSISELTKQYDKLCAYKDRITQAIERYDIKPSEFTIDEDSLTRADMEALVAKGIEACEHLGDGGIRGKLKLIYTPEGDDAKSRAYHGFAVIILLLVFAPILFFVLVGYMIHSVRHIYKYVDGLRVADKLMYGINFAKFRDDPELEAIPTIDLAEAEAAKNSLLEVAEASNPEILRTQLAEELIAHADEFEAQTKAVNMEATMAFATYTAAISAHLMDAQEMLDKYMSNIKSFNDEQRTSYVLDYDAVLGLKDGIFEEKYPVLSQNIVFADNSPMMLDFIKLLLSNMLINVRPRQLTVTIYDPERLGQDYATFLDDEVKQYIFVETSNFQRILDEHRAFAQKNYRLLDNREIIDFNTEAEAKGIVSIEYKLLIIAADDESLYKDQVFLEFMKSSARAGVHIWMIGPTPIDNCLFYGTPFEGVDNPYPVTYDTISKAVKTYIKGMSSIKDKGILYKPSFQDKYMPEEKWWQENCDEGIKLNFGLQDGDPSKGFDIMLCDMPVHGLCAGSTGAGKSAFINQLLATLVTRYPPSALELILIDFKNVEFAALTDKATHLSKIPHARIVAGTKDGEYAVSIFEYALKEHERRSETFAAAETKKLEEYNKKMRAQGHEEKCLPRVLILIDEFQVMFSLDRKIVERVQVLIQQISKLTRASGIHLFFTSQSMQGTMSKDVKDQFSLRVALRCSAEVSNELIGSQVASQIKSKFGYLYSNTNAGNTQDSTTLWRTPFIPNETLFDTEEMNKKIEAGKMPPGSMPILDKIQQMAQERGEHDFKAYFYDSKERWPDTHLKEWLNTHEDVVKNNSGLVIIGERTNFSTNNAPVNFRIRRSDGENLLIWASDDTDLCNLTSTVITNIAQDPNNILLFNSADDDYHNVLNIKDIVNPQFLDISYPSLDPSGWIDFLEGSIRRRKQEGMEGKQPVYFFAIRWEKQNGIYRGENYKLVERWRAVMQNAPGVDIHIVLVTQSFRELQGSTLACFNHRIVGQGPEDGGYRIIETSRCGKLYESDESPQALYCFGKDISKFKIYQYTYQNTFSKRELIL